MEYFEINLKVETAFAEILLAEMSAIGFDSFVETDDGLLAYIEKDHFDQAELDALINEYQNSTHLEYIIKPVAKQNWNKEWESHFSPIDVEGKVYIRATFHDPAPANYLHEIVIVPKMSFGTGHHETTSQMITLQMDINHKGKSVLDVGTGTGILAIMAHKLGATKIHAFDIDEWSVENGEENFHLNGTDNISIDQSTIDKQNDDKYDIVLANINRNVLLNEIPKYAERCNDYLIVSGFYNKDLEAILSVAEPSGFKKVKHISKNDWAAVVFSK